MKVSVPEVVAVQIFIGVNRGMLDNSSRFRTLDGSDRLKRMHQNRAVCPDLKE